MLTLAHHKLHDVLDGGEARRKREAEEERLRIEKEKEEARVNVEAQRGFAGKVIPFVCRGISPAHVECCLQVHDVFDGGKHRKELEEAEFQRIDQEAQTELKKHETLSDKVRVLAYPPFAPL